MTARPGNWYLIADSSSDPVPGDPDAVRTQAAYYTSMAESIQREAGRLKSLGEAGTLVGKYSDAMKKELGDLSDDVMKAHGRYASVGTALKPYATALDNARAESWGALHDADTAHASQTSANNMPNPQASDDKKLTDAQRTQASSRTTAINNANDALSRAKTRLSNALDDLNRAGKRAADGINDGSDDSLKDHHHWWDVIVKMLKVIVEVLNYVVIVLAIVALFIPGLDVIVLAISLAILAIDTLLAATGNGSWMDVFVDIFALVTLGAGRGLARAGERGVETAMEGATKSAIKSEFRNSGNFFMRNFVGRGAKMARATETGTAKVADFAAKFRAGAENSINGMDALMSGGRDLAKSSKMVTALDSEFGGVSRLTKASMAGLRTVNRPVWAVGLTVPALNTGFSESNLPGIIGERPFSETWEHVKSDVSYSTPISASEYNWNDHPVVSAAVSGAIYGPLSAIPGIGG